MGKTGNSVQFNKYLFYNGLLRSMLQRYICFIAKKELLLADTAVPQNAAANQNPAGGVNQQPAVAGDDDDFDADPHDVSTSDFIIMQSSFECRFTI